jgi:SH3-like domain-containing protein
MNCPSSSRNRLSAVCAAAFAILAFATLPILAQSSSNPSGLPLPRFATLRSTPVNVRVGPGTRYDIAWRFLKAGLPVEIIAEFDVWRKIRYYTKDETGWVHQSLLSGSRGGLVTPWADKGQTALRAAARNDAPVRAWLKPNLLVSISSCDGTWCAVTATGERPGGKEASYSGFLAQGAIWGVYQNEKFN